MFCVVPPDAMIDYFLWGLDNIGSHALRVCRLLNKRTEMTSFPSVAYLGMGIMGASMAVNMAKSGISVTVWNRSKGREGTKRAVEAGAQECESIKNAVSGAELIFLCLSDVQDLEDVLFREGGVVECATAGSIIIDMSTTGPECARRVSEKLALKNLSFIDAPVSGGDVGARNGTLTIMAAGKEDCFNRCLPVFQKIGKNIHYCGNAGNGQAVKLCNQILCAVNMIAVCESLSLAEQLSIDPSLMIEVCSSGAAGSWALANLGPRIIANNLEPGFMIKDMQKDLRLVREALSGSALNFAGSDLANQKFDEAVAVLSNGGELKGTQAMIAAYRALGAKKT